MIQAKPPRNRLGYMAGVINQRLVITVVSLALIVAALLPYGIGWYREIGLSELPRVDVAEGLAPGVQQQIDDALQAARHNPQDALANVRLGMVLHAYQRYAEAALCYERANALAPDYGAAYLLGLSRAELGQWDEAVAALEQSLRLKPDYPAARLRLAELLRDGGRVEKSDRMFQELLRDLPNYPYMHLEYGKLLKARGETKTAGVHFTRAFDLAREVGSGFGAAHYQLAQVHRRLGEKAAAEGQLALYRQQKDEKPPRLDPLLEAVYGLKRGALEHNQAAEALMTEGRHAEARSELLKALKAEPGNMGAHANLIAVAGRLDGLEQAKEHYRAALVFNPDWAQAHYGYGLVLCEHGRYAVALEPLRHAIRSNPHFVAAYTQLGLALEKTGQSGEAVQSYRRALDQEAGHARANALLGALLVRTGQHQAAVAPLQRALAEGDADRAPALKATLGTAHLELDQPNVAMDYFRQAREGAMRLGQTELVTALERKLQELTP